MFQFVSFSNYNFFQGVAFSARPIEMDEIVIMKLSDTAANWSGVFRFGVTNCDPVTFAGNVPKYVPTYLHMYFIICCNFGFSSHTQSTLDIRSYLICKSCMYLNIKNTWISRYTCPDMTNKDGSWAKAISERHCQKGNIIHFYVRRNGELYYGVNGVQKGLFLSSINTNLPLWVVVDIYGNSTAVEFLGGLKYKVQRVSMKFINLYV